METLLFGWATVRIEKLQKQEGWLEIVVKPLADKAICPLCEQCSTRVHSSYQRSLQDLPCCGQVLRLQLMVRRFFCDNDACGRKVFTERVSEVVQPYARRTIRHNEALTTLGLALGGEAGQRTAAKLGLQTSAATLLRRIRALPDKEATSVRVLGVDDFAFRRGQHYGTILIDAEQRQPIDLLPDREGATLTQWLKNHPEIAVITRDRAGAYADGARQGAPQAQQVADRWHLLKNANEAFEHLLQREQSAIRTAVSGLPALPVPLVTTKPAVPETIPPVVAETPREYTRSQAARARRQAYHTERKLRYEKVQALKQEGFTIMQIKKHVGWTYGTVANFFRAAEYPVNQRGRRESGLDKFDTYLRERWEAGAQNAKHLFQEVQAHGYTGSAVTVRRHVQLWRKLPAETLPPAATKHAVPAPRACVWLLLKEEAKQTETEQQIRQAVLQASPRIQQGLTLVKGFRTALCSGSEAKLETWMAEAAASQLSDFENFVKGLRRDEAAVCAAASSEWSNGQTEGQVNRLKMLKRQMYGRANFDLLRLRVLYAP